MDMGLDILSRKMEFRCMFRLFYLTSHFSHRINTTSCASSKHLQTRRFLDTLQGYLLDIQRLLIQLHRSANERAAPFVDHLGILRDSKTGRPINGTDSDEDEVDVTICEFSLLEFDDICFILTRVLAGYSFFDSGDVALLGRKKSSPFSGIGKLLDFFLLHNLPTGLIFQVKWSRLRNTEELK